MQKRVKKKRRSTVLVYAIVVLFISIIAYTFSAIYLKQYNNELSVSIQQREVQIKSLQDETEALQVEIDKLATKTKVADAIEDENMEHNKDNIVYINGNSD